MPTEETPSDEDTVPCDLCGEHVPFSVYAEHANAHAHARLHPATPFASAAAWHTGVLMSAGGQETPLMRRMMGPWSLSPWTAVATRADGSSVVIDAPGIMAAFGRAFPGMEAFGDDDDDDDGAGTRARGLDGSEVDAAIRAVSGDRHAQLQDDDLCPICLVAMNACDVSKVSQVKECGHVFCDACVRSWLGFGRCCPVCKVELAPPIVEPVEESTGMRVSLAIRIVNDPDPGDDDDQERERAGRLRRAFMMDDEGVNEDEDEEEDEEGYDDGTGWIEEEEYDDDEDEDDGN
jgi:hypothetical protein